VQLSAWLKAEASKPRKQRRNLKQLHLELKELGYEGSYDRVAAFARQWKVGQTEWVNSASKRTYSVTNGLLLRADLHTLFDLGLLALNTQLRVELAPSLLSSEYKKLEGKKLRQSLRPSEAPSKDALEQRYRDFQATHCF
jgi:hypothetical protein